GRLPSAARAAVRPMSAPAAALGRSFTVNRRTSPPHRPISSPLPHFPGRTIMVQRMSKLLLKTLREDPADAETASHKLLVRAGFVRRSSAGVWTWLPLGKRVMENVARVVREEMDAIGGQEVLLPALLPRELYEATGRADD